MKWIMGVSILAIAMGWAATATIPAATITPDEATLALLPPETQGVAFIDVAALKDAPLVKETLAGGHPSFPRELTEFMTATGFDVERDVDAVTIGRMGDQILAIVQARYDKFKAEQFFKDKGREPEAYLGRSIFVGGRGAFTFQDNMIIAGQADAVKRAIDQMSLPASPSLRAELMDSIRTIEAGNQVWAAGQFSVADFPALRGPAPAMEIIKKLQGGTYQMRVDDGIHAKGIANFSDAETARGLSDMCRGFIAVAKLQVAKEQPDLLRVLDGIQVNSSGTSVMVDIEQSGELLKKLKGLHSSLGKGD